MAILAKNPPGKEVTISDSMNTASDNPTWFKAKAAKRKKEMVLLKKLSKL